MLAGLRANWVQADTGPQSFCHGDPHQGNMFFESDGTPGYLDFQAYVRSAPLHDVNYVVVGSLSVEDRRRHARDLLGFYLRELAALGVSDLWPEAEAWERFQQHTMHGLLWFATPEEMQPAAIVEAHSRRFGAAAEDYDLARLLGV
jgi:aminoglycoside phosphotransferase (APT) family kinase protein